MRALWGGILFSLAFTAFIWWAGSFLDGFRATLIPDQGVAWYYWQLPQPLFWPRFTAWAGYLLHQVALWGLIWYAQSRPHKYIGGLHPVNIAALGVNVFFILLHFAQTHLWYDGLAQDVSIFTSQGSVIVMLVWILLMENKRRGLFLGKKISFSQNLIDVARKYHGYVFSWAIVYTFWYHPMETTAGHLIGFFYMFLLLLQGSLFFTRVHVNKWWTLVQELTVLVHGAVVAWLQSGPTGFWPMFGFGFLSLFVITQMYGLGLSRRWLWMFWGAYVVSTAAVYSVRGWGNLNEIIRIPVIEYLAVFVLAGLIWLGLRVVSLFRRKPQASTPAGAAAD